ncbi:hypothetical protein Bhyg_09573 [Pseudolycoriella hygida]|uniref:Uncharacterized protein n=1 Tax=Pseudolycoriella hygida TaxID=35572 RepID=A0A9Q0N8L4_9DIPT|nr:hypothetical protein Bhyg_09573 [Pseudolycoriella hygida]
MATIHSKYIRRYQSTEHNNYFSNNDIVNDSNFRILEITEHSNTDSKDSLWRMKGDYIRKLFIESESSFFVIIRIADEQFDQTICERIITDVFYTLMNCGKYVLVEICHGVKKIVRYILDGETKDELLNEQLTDFFEFVDESLLLSRVNSSAFNNLRNVSSIPLPLHCILIRLVRLCDIPCSEDVEKIILENFVRHSNVECCRAFLDLPHIDDGEPIKHTALTTRAMHYEYRMCATLLFFAAGGKIAMLKLLLRLGADVYTENLLSETASDHINGNYQNLLVLLEHDAKFPNNFHQINAMSAANCSDKSLQRIRKIYEERQKLHKAIIDKNEEFIASFEEKHPNLKFAYTFIDEASLSRAATTTALMKGSQNDDFAMYFYLISKGFCVNDNELYFLKKADKSKVSAIILNRLKFEQQSHVSFLIGKTFVSGVDTSKHKEKIVQIYKKLNELTDLTSILKIVEHSKSLTISVDFRNKSVLNLDMNASSTMDGITYHNLGRIYLGVADKDDKEIGGLIIHELTHIALHIVFNNHGSPYHNFDVDKEKEFKEIVDKVKEFRQKLPEVVNDVYVAYSESSWPKELIARVPQLISMGLSCGEEMAELFKFYRVNVLTYMERLTRNPENFFIKREVNQLNEFLRHVEEIEKWNIALDKTCLDKALYDGRSAKKVVCNIPRLFLTDFYNEVVKKSLICTPSGGPDSREQSEKHIIFASIEDFVNARILTYIQRVWHLTSNITLVLDVEKIVDLKRTLQNFVEELKSEATSKNIVVFGTEQSVVALGAHFQCFTRFTLNYTWKHLKKCYRDTLLSKKINFQGAMVPLNTLIDDDFISIPMEKLVNNEDIIIVGSVNYCDEEIFVERNVKHFEQVCNTSDLLLLTSKPMTNFILSGCAGSGQSTVMSRIASLIKDRNPHFWLIGVNAQQFVLASKDTADVEHFAKHFVSPKSSATQFELNLFKMLYNKSKVIFLFDSFVDLSDDYVEQAILLIKILSEKNQFWITTHANSPTNIKLEEELVNKVVLELQPFLWLDHVSCVTKIWRKLLRFDLANEGIYRHHAVALLGFYQDFIEFPNLTATIANKYLTCINEYITQGSEEPFVPGNIYTNGIMDIHDLLLDMYSDKIHRRQRQPDAANEIAEAVILGMNMFTAFNQFAEYFLEGNNMTNTPLGMYLNGAEDLFRNGIITHNWELSRIGTGPYFFLSNYIVKSMETDSRVYGQLCCIISSHHVTGNYKLIKVIEGRMKDSILFCGAINFRNFPFAQKHEKYPKLKWDDVMYLLDEDAILLLCFIIQFPSTPLNECFDKCALYWKASAKALRCVIEILWNCSNEKFIKYLAQDDSKKCNPFQYAFMNFPQSDIDVIKDTTTADELSEALRLDDKFTEKLNESTDEKYRNSTLKFYVDRILNSETFDVRKTFIFRYSIPPAINQYKISSKHFDTSIEMKWMAMTHLKFPINEWMELTTKTVFKNVIHIIFNEFNNHIVMQFYKWAETKVGNREIFNAFVADTFVNFFWNCTSVKHGKEIVSFIRDKINVEEVLIQRGIEIFNDKFGNKIATYHALFTAKEFEIILFHTPKNKTNLITKICSCNDDETIFLTFAAIPLKKIIDKVGITVNLVHSLLWFLIGSLDELRDESVIKYITEFIGKQERELISDALCIFTFEGSFFNVAFARRDMFMAKLIWKICRFYLNEEQFRFLLLDQYDVYPNLVTSVTKNEFLHEQPSMQNTNCQTACFEYLPFELGCVIMPEFAVSLNDKNQIYIGRCKVYDEEGYLLCKIEFNQIQVIGFNNVQPLTDSLEILIGKGLVWTKHTDDDGERQLYFLFKQKLLKRRNDNILLVDKADIGGYYLAYDDAAARGNDIVHCFRYYQGRSL